MKYWQTRLGVGLLVLSALTYLAYYLIFDNLYTMLMYATGDLAFVFINVLLVTLIIQSLLDRREKDAMIGKMSTVIGAFFSELGMPLIHLVTDNGRRLPTFGRDLHVGSDWTDKDYDRAVHRLAEEKIDLMLDAHSLAEIKPLLMEKRTFLLGMMENPNLLEHERFTELLLALFHVQEELMNRKDVSASPPSDISHLNNDVNRAFSLMVREWLMHTRHLQKNYPYLFSLMVRTNPFDPDADTVVRG
ncbi:MAG TPA: hypothetical protein VGK23_04850 [Methanomassiliicoccales archaeon]|jgi:hypothetical protein